MHKALKNYTMKQLFFSVGFTILLIGCMVKAPKTIDAGSQSNQTKTLNTQSNPLRAKYLVKGDSIRVFVNFLTEEPENAYDITNKFALKYALKLDPTKVEKLDKRLVTLNEETVFCKDKMVQLQFDLPNNSTTNNYVLHLSLEEKNREIASYELVINQKSSTTADNFGFFKGDRLLVEGFSSGADTLQLKNLMNTNVPLTLVKYSFEFEPAYSPTLVGNKLASKQLYVDTLFNVTTNQNIILEENTLYLVLKDTLDRYGFSHLTENNRFPKYTLAEQLYQPLKYICTNNEFNQLINAENKKQAIDFFWLSNSENGAQGSQKTISKFYKRVYEANTLFSSYKQGWKTDKGMVYIIMGKPHSISHKKDKEIWSYLPAKDFAEVNFTFNRKPNQFYQEHYELSRYADFGAVWFPKVASIRNGSADNN
jgi:GWxTD domain-containing protein